MALSASLSLDIKAFQAGLDKAEVELQTFERATKTVNRDLKRLMEDFSGQKVAVEAERMAEAVKRIGGASKLTEADQRRVNAAVTEALAKYRALGQEAPAHLVKLQAETAKADKATGLLSSSVGKMIASFTLAGLAESAIRGAASGVGEFVKRGGEVAGMRNAFNALSGGVDAANARIGAIRVSTRGLVDDFSAMQASNKATLLGLGLGSEQMGELAKTATILGRAMGQDATKSLDDLITALGRSSPMILDNLGLSVKVGEANEKYAKALGKTAEALTDAEKKQAFMNAAMDAAKEKVETLGPLQLTAADRLAQMWTGVTNVTDAMATWAVSIGPVNFVLGKFVDNMKLAEELFRGGLFSKGPRAALDEYKRQIGDVIPKVAELSGNWRGLQAPAAAVVMSTTDMDKAAKALTETVQKNIESSKEFNKQLQNFGGADAIAKANEMVRVLGALGGPLRVMPSQLETMAKAMREASDAAMLSGRFDLAQQYDALARTLAPVVQLQQRYNVTIGQFVTTSDDYAQAVRDQIDVLTQLDKTLSFGVLPNVGKLNQAWAPFKAAVDQNNPSLRTMGQRLQQVAKESADTAQSLRSLSGVLAEMAQISGSRGLGSLAKLVGGVAGAVESTSKFTEALGDKSIKTGARILQMASAAATLAASLQSVASSGNRAVGTISAIGTGASAGATIGSAIAPGVGTGVGAVIGASLGLMASLFGEVKKAVDRIAPPMRTWPELLANATDEAGFLSKEMRNTLASMIKFGEVTKEVREYLKGQGAAALEGFNAVAAGVERWSQYGEAVAAAQKKVDDLNKTEQRGRGAEWTAEMAKAQAELTAALTAQQKAGEGARGTLADLGTQALAAFNAALASGMSFTDALKKVQPGIQAVIKAYESLGIPIDNVALKALAMQSQLLEKNPQILAGINGLSQGLTALSNLGALNPETFAAMQRTAMDMFTRIQGEVAAMGGSQKDALLPMQQYLRDAEKAAKQLGVPLDANTQMLIDQSKELGIWKDNAIDPMEDMTNATRELAKAIREMIDELKNLPNLTTTEIRTKYTREDETGDGPRRGFAGGSGGVRDFGRGTEVVLHGRERVQTEEQMLAEREALINDGAASRVTGSSVTTSGTTTVLIDLDGRRIAEAVVPHIPSALNRSGVRVATWP